MHTICMQITNIHQYSKYSSPNILSGPTILNQYSLLLLLLWPPYWTCRMLTQYSINIQYTRMSHSQSDAKSIYVKNTSKCVPEGSKNDHFTQPESSLAYHMSQKCCGFLTIHKLHKMNFKKNSTNSSNNHLELKVNLTNTSLHFIYKL